MRVKVIKQYRDKYTNNLHRIGNEIEISKERFEEINSTSFGIFVKVIEQDGGISDYVQKYQVTEDYLLSLTKRKIIEYAKEKGIELDMKMSKTEMIKELM